MPISPSWTILRAGRWSRRSICLSLLLAAFAAASTPAQTITVRLRNEAANSPLANYEVRVFGLKGNNQPPQPSRHRRDKESPPDLTLKTDATGSVHFDLPAPAPDRFSVRAVLNEPRWDCYCMISVVTQEIVKSGRLINSPGGRAEPHVPSSPNPSPGEILFSLSPIPWWMQVLYPLLRD